jgi:hypothetical protein
MIRSLARAGTALAAALALGPLAVAQASGSHSSTTPAPPATTTPAPPATTSPAPPTTTTPTPPAVRAKAQLAIEGAYAVSGQRATIPGRPFVLTGVVKPYVAGQKLTLRAIERGRTIVTRVLAVKPGGHFAARLVLNHAGAARLSITHHADAAMLGLQAAKAIEILDTRTTRGPFIRLIQQRLALLHVYVHVSGVYDSFTAWALDAYHRLLGWGASTVLDHRTIVYLLNGWGQFKARFPGHGRHAEGDLTHQLLALVDGRRVEWIFPISSGKPSTPTILGDFRIYSRVPGYLPDGMYYSDFFIRGYAIHGYDPAPDYPASHGCMRLPIQDAIFVYDWLAMGDWVDTYYR